MRTGVHDASRAAALRSRGRGPAVRTAGAWASGLVLLTACSVDGRAAEPAATRTPSTSTSSPSAATAPATPSAPSATPAPSTPTPEPVEPAYVASDGEPRDAVMSIPEIGVTDLEVEAYEGHTDDAAGHAIQNTGIAASPHGPEGGTGPGGIGNYQVTGHRNSAGGVFLDLPELEPGDQVRVTAGDTVFVYRITTTRITSFRSERSLREQRAAVPGRPGATPTRAMITISTCRTQEDHAEGNFWSDEFDNPENRIDKIGVLVRTRPA